jgi:hypothetical protein
LCCCRAMYLMAVSLPFREIRVGPQSFCFVLFLLCFCRTPMSDSARLLQASSSCQELLQSVIALFVIAVFATLIVRLPTSAPATPNVASTYDKFTTSPGVCVPSPSSTDVSSYACVAFLPKPSCAPGWRAIDAWSTTSNVRVWNATSGWCDCTCFVVCLLN